MDRYLTTGQVAQELKTTSQTVRNYCESGVIQATRSAGGHYRIEPAELARLKSLESLPPVARATLSGNSAGHRLNATQTNFWRSLLSTRSSPQKTHTRASEHSQPTAIS
jgi:excisionase family DNA binding protein